MLIASSTSCLACNVQPTVGSAFAAQLHWVFVVAFVQVMAFATM
jgi:hypothetical protein